MSERGQVGSVARALGFAGLLPQAAALLLILFGRGDRTDLAWMPLMLGYGFAMLYAALILSFLGGMWWAFAMRLDRGQGVLAGIAVMPALVAAALVCSIVDWPRLSPWAAVAMGSAIALTLLVDRRLADRGIAPEGWMRLRIPLSLGLGALTIAAGILVAP